MPPARGLIYRLDFDAVLQGAWEGEPQGPRYVVVVSPGWLNAGVETVLVAPTTASNVDEKAEMLTNVLLVPGRTATGIERRCVVQLHLLYAVNVVRLGERVGLVTCPDARDELLRAAAFAVGDAEEAFAERAPERG